MIMVKDLKSKGLQIEEEVEDLIEAILIEKKIICHWLKEKT